jgi:dihydrolipoamide dehydrogenase
MKDISCKLLVIGAGPGGYVCAIRAGQLGVDTVIVEAASPAAPASPSAAFPPRR